ncbi:MAG TPA: hypothetical protein VHH36_05520, partial [Candidatus Thermoplasmatota archaeon]|nr:hypothetical protein [Candidatus Thermoplasmatota archaeon]
VFVEPSLFDGSSFGLGSACGSEPLCPSGETVLVVDPSGDDLPDGTDPSGDDVVLACDDVLVGGTQVPVGDGEYEFGLGLQFLPASHHDPKAHGYTVAPVGTVGGFVFGADLDSDGDVEDGSDDCYESHDLPGAHTTACDAGMDDGWWFFPTCRAEAFPDSQAEPGDPVAYFTRDRDFNGSPDWLDDRDSDGQPDGIQDWDGDGHPDALTSWNEVALGDPDPGAGCTAAGHINSD